MIGKIFGETSIQLLERGLDASAFRQGILVDNVANLETPGYRRYDMDFIGYLDQSIRQDNPKLPLKITHEKHYPAGPSQLKELDAQREEFAVRQDASGVDIEKEMTLILKNTLYHQTLSRMISDKFNGLKTIAREVR